jgi:hypothetical protein
MALSSMIPVATSKDSPNLANMSLLHQTKKEKTEKFPRTFKHNTESSNFGWSLIFASFN